MIFSDSADSASSHSWGKAVEYLKDKEHIDPIWLPYIFGGMPIASALMFPRDLNYAEFLIQLPGKLIFLNAGMAWMVLHYFLMGVFMYILARQMKFTHLPSLFAAITFMLNPYAIGLAQSAHGTKLMTLTFIPLVFLLTYTLFQKRNILSLGLLAAATGTMFLNKHPQIAFYGLLAIGCYFIYEFILDIRKTPVLVLKKALLLGLALGIGFAIYTYEFLPTQQYAPYSIRGGSGESASSGLSYDYATSWSYHPFEMLAFGLPSAFGFSSGYVADWQGQERVLPLYWGWMPFTDGPVYIGVIPILLIIFSLIYARNRSTWFFVIFSVLVLFMSFGNHLGIVYNLFFNYLPYFNKFRAPAMILCLIPFTFGILAAYGMTYLIQLPQKAKDFDLEKFRKRMLIVLGILGGVLVLGFIAKSGLYDWLSGFMFVKAGEVQEYGQQVVNLFMEKRFEIFWNDLVKMIILAGAFLGIIVFYLTRKKAPTIASFGIIALLVIDLFVVDLKLINPKPNTALEEVFQPDATVKFLQKDSTLYRVFPIGRTEAGQDLFQDNTFMYHNISSVGGYSPAKLKIYQDLIESSLYKGSDPQFPINMNVVNMLNAKYFVAQGRLPEDKFTLVNMDQEKKMLTYSNPGVLPRAWFVDSVIISGSKAGTFEILNSRAWDPKTTAILEKQPVQKLSKSTPASVTVTSYQSQKMVINAVAGGASLLVVSEIYYPAGWKAYIDGNETEIYKTNYVLRSVIVPAGRHTVEFRTDASVYQTGLSLTNAGWGVSLILILVGLAQVPAIRQKIGLKKKESTAVNPDESAGI